MEFGVSNNVRRDLPEILSNTHRKHIGKDNSRENLAILLLICIAELTKNARSTLAGDQASKKLVDGGKRETTAQMLWSQAGFGNTSGLATVSIKV